VSLSKAGLDFTHKDSSVRPQDDLYRHFNGQWLKTAVIPADRATDGAGALQRILTHRPSFDATRS
jgi:putative endopeptidase